MTDAQTLIREAQGKAERLCALAVEQTPAANRSFITLIEQRKKVGGTRQAPVFASVRQPYLSVDGRVKWARDEHLRVGKRFDVQMEFVVEPTSGQLLAREGRRTGTRRDSTLDRASARRRCVPEPLCLLPPRTIMASKDTTSSSAKGPWLGSVARVS